MRHRFTRVLLGVALSALLGGTATVAARSHRSAASYNVGVVYSRTGLLAAYGAEYVEGRLWTEDRERLPPAFVGRAVEDQHAVKVVELVLDNARLELVELEMELLAVRRSSLQRHVCRTLDRNRDALWRVHAVADGLRHGPVDGR